MVGTSNTMGRSTSCIKKQAEVEKENVDPHVKLPSTNGKIALLEDIEYASCHTYVTRRNARIASKRSKRPSHQRMQGLWSLLPQELVEKILKLCTPNQLGMLSATCKHFQKSDVIESIARERVAEVPRAKSILPSIRNGENWVHLLSFVTCQSTAAAQGTALAFGSCHSTGLLVPHNDNGTVSAVSHSLFTWGRGFHGQLGNSQHENQERPGKIALGYKPCQDKVNMEEEIMPAVVACGSAHSLSISRRGELFSWGLASSGELGQGGWMPIEISSPRQCILPGGNVRIVSVAAGANHTLAIAENGTLWTCGRGRLGQLGLGAFQDIGSLTSIESLKGVRIVSAAAGIGHSLALASDGSLYSWGDGRYGQLGHSQLENAVQWLPPNVLPVLPTPQKILEMDPARLLPGNRITAIAAGAHHSMVLTVNGGLLAFGRNKHGELGTGDNVNKWRPVPVNLQKRGSKMGMVRAVQVVCGAAHSVALVMKNGATEIRTAGHNLWGQLGHGDTDKRNTFTPVFGVRRVIAVQAGDNHSAAVTSDGSLFMWGRGDCGQLGLGDERSRFKPTLIPGYKVVHPDRTLRRHKRNSPQLRVIPTKGRSAKAA